MISLKETIISSDNVPRSMQQPMPCKPCKRTRLKDQPTSGPGTAASGRGTASPRGAPAQSDWVTPRGGEIHHVKLGQVLRTEFKHLARHVWS